MTSGPSILHADLDAFYASVEQRDDPALRGRPVVVGTGVVLACSYEAKARGIYTTMNGKEARRVCPEVIAVPPRMAAYSEASRRVYEIFDETAPVVEALSIDEAFLDVRGLEHISGTPTEIAAALRREVREKVGLNISVGVARTKFLAKVASGESKPDGLLVVPESEEEAFLHPLPIRKLWGVGKVTAGKLESAGIFSVGDIARAREATLAALVGASSGKRLLDLANNRDPRTVAPRERRRSIGAQSAFPRSSRTADEIQTLGAALTDRVCGRLRESGQSCRTVSLSLRFGDFSRASRARTLDFPTDRTDTVLAAVRGLLDSARDEIEDRGLTLVGVSLENLDRAGSVQLSLALPTDREEATGDSIEARDTAALDAALDAVRNRFGADSIRRASLIDADAGVSAPTLPD
ncbi:MAG: DNA polymerase IV [Actinomycetota bacterium]|nr:DNA polymerase IV [Actinomycetota bacterium]